MPRIIIEINDTISDQVEKKISQIDTAAKFASVSVSSLGDALGQLNTKALGGLEKSINGLVNQIEKANQAQRELLNQSKLSSIQSDKLSASVQKVAIAEEKANQERLKTQIQEERLRQITDKGNDALERKLAKLDKVTEAERRLAIEAEKRYQIEVKSAYGLIRTNGVTERGIGKSGISEAVALRTVRASEEQLKSEKQISDNVDRQLRSKVAINNLRNLSSSKLNVEAEKRVAENIERQLRAKLAINNLRQSNTARQALGGGGGAVGTGGGGFFGGGSVNPENILRNNKELGRSIDLYRTFGTILRTIHLAQYARDLALSTDTYTLINNRLKLVSTSLGESRGLYKDLLDIANETRAPIENLARSFVRFDYALKPLGATQRESIKFTKTFSQQLAISGLAIQEQSSVLLQMSQALNKGKLDGDEFRTVMETLPTVATAIAKQMGVARGELIELAPQGKITASIIREAMASIAEDTDKAFKDLTPTVGQAFVVLNNSVIDSIGKINELTGFTNSFAKSIIFVADNIGILSATAATAAIIFTTNLFPSVIGGIAAIKVAGLALLSNPIFLIPAAVAASLIAVKQISDRFNAEVDAQTAKDNAKADAADKERESRRKSLIYETEATIKLRTEYGKYLVVLAETKNAQSKGFISELAKQALLAETTVGKGRERAEELINEKSQGLLLDSDVFAKDSKALSDKYNKSIVELENFVRESTALKHVHVEKEKAANKELEKSQKQYGEVLKQIEALVVAKDSGLISENEIKKLDRMIELETNRFILAGKDLKIREKIATQETTSANNAKESLNKDLSLYESLVNVLKERLEILRRIGIEGIKADVINSKYRMQKQYNDTLKATNELIVSGNINQAEAKILLDSTDLLKTRTAINDKINAFEVKNITEKRIDDINREKEAILLLIEANIKNFETTADYERARAKTISASNEKKNIVKEDLKKDILVFSGSGIDARYEAEMKAENKAFEERKKALKASRDDALKTRNETGRSVIDILLEYNELDLKATKEHENKKISIAQLSAAERIDIAAGMFGALSNLASKFVVDGGKNSQRAFKITKALAYAEAVATTASAIAKANDNPFPYNIPAIIAAAATGAAQIATIKNTEMPAFAKGAVSIGGSGTSTSDSMLAHVSRGESYINATSTSRHRNLLEAINADNSSTTSSTNNTYLSGNQSGGVIVNIHNNGSNEVRQETSVNSNGQKQIDIYVEQVEKKLAQKYADGNGPLAKAIDGKRLRDY